MTEATRQMITGGLEVIIFATLYLMPTINAYRRRHPKFDGIMLTNLFFGWTMIGWCAALIWSCSVPAPKKEKRS